MRETKVGILALLLFSSIAIAIYLGTQTQQAEQLQEITLNGAGATFPFPLLSKMSREYLKVNPSVKINYQSIGSGGGIRQHTVKTVDFGASDVPLTDEQFNNAPNTLHIPFTIGAVVPTYNMPIGTGIKFTGEVLADIFLGKIKKWNDPKLKELNPDLNLPDKEIIVVHRSDGSGTTFVWADYLSTVSEEWKQKVGKGTSVNWPVGLGGKGNEGVAGLIKQNPYSLGYNEFAYAKLEKISYGFVKNKAGNFIEPSLESFAAAAAAFSQALPRGDESWSKITMVNAPGTKSYPITSFSYLLVYKELNVLPGIDNKRAKALVDFLWWATHEGQQFAPELVYVPLPKEIIEHNENTLKMITFNGQQVKK